MKFACQGTRSEDKLELLTLYNISGLLLPLKCVVQSITDRVERQFDTRHPSVPWGPKHPKLSNVSYKGKRFLIQWKIPNHKEQKENVLIRESDPVFCNNGQQSYPLFTMGTPLWRDTLINLQKKTSGSTRVWIAWVAWVLMDLMLSGWFFTGPWT